MFSSNPLQYVNVEATLMIEGAPQVADAEALSALDDDTQRRWRLAMQRLFLAPSMNYFENTVEARALTGLNAYDVQQTAFFGLPETVLLAGEFDIDAVQTALENYGYAAQAIDDAEAATIWRRADGQDDMAMSLEDRSAFMFGGDFGRKLPVAILPDGTIASSPIQAMLARIAQTQAGHAPNLLSQPEYFTAVDAILNGEAMDDLVQAAFFHPLYFPAMTELTVGDILSGSVNQEAIDAVNAYLEPSLPPYSLAYFADGQSGEMSILQVGLVYRDIETAQEALPILEARIRGMARWEVEGVDAQPLLDGINGAEVSAIVYEGERGAAAIVSIHYPAGEDFAGNRGPYGRLYNIFMRLFTNRALFALWY